MSNYPSASSLKRPANNKANEVNNQLQEVSQNASIELLGYCNNLSPKKHLNCSKLYLNEKGSAKRSSLFLNYNLESHKWYDTRRTNSDISKIVYDTDESQLLTYSSTIPFSSSIFFGKKFMYLNLNNIHHLIIAFININSIRNKFDALVSGIQRYINTMMTSSTKLIGYIETYTYRLNRNGSVGGILVYMREVIPSKLEAVDFSGEKAFLH